MLNLIWTFPVLMLASIIIGWAAEITALQLSVGLALAVLAWLQCAPEFAVEALIASQQNQELALANLTGSLRLLLGFGWPVIFFIHWRSHRKQHSFLKLEINLDPSFAVEAMGLFIPIIYFVFILLKSAWTAVDGILLCSFYGIYLWTLNLERKKQKKSKDNLAHSSDEDEAWIVAKAEKWSSLQKSLLALFLFIVGGSALLFIVHPFLEALKATAVSLGISQYVFIQWIAPVASEFPEKITAFNWARKSKKISMAIVNMLSSVTSQWTLLAGLIPIIFCISAGKFITIEFSDFQKTELLLTILQSTVVVALLMDLKLRGTEALGLFLLWILQFLIPNTRSILIYFYAAWAIFEIGRQIRNPKQMLAIIELRKLFSRF